MGSKTLSPYLPPTDEPTSGESLSQWQTRLVMQSLPEIHRTAEVEKMVYHGINGALLKALELTLAGKRIPVDQVIAVQPASVRLKMR